MDERISERTVLGRTVACQIAGVASTVQMYDLSMDGCMVEAPKTLCEGNELSVQLLDHFDAVGTVIWIEQGRAGVLFNERIQPAIVQYLGFPLPGRLSLSALDKPLAQDRQGGLTKS